MVKVSQDICTEIEHDVLMRCIPVLGDIELHQHVNFCNVKSLDILVMHCLNAIQFISTDSAPVIDLRTLRLLLTIATRISDINWTDTHSANDLSSLNTDKESNHEYSNIVSLRDRAYIVFKKYLEILKTQPQVQSQVHKLVHELLSDFLSAKGTRSETRASTTKRRGNDVLHMLENSPKRKSVRQVIKPDVNTEEGDMGEENPQTEDSIGRSLEEQIDDAMERFNPSASQQDIHSKLSESIEFVNKLTVMASKGATPETSESQEHFRVFDEPLISDRLKPTEDNKYSIWSLIEYTFYCARNGVKTRTSNDTSTDFHTILYNNYSNFLQLVFEFLSYDFDIQLKNYFSKVEAESEDQDEVYRLLYGRRLDFFRKKMKDSSLLFSVLFQRTNKSIYLYDRVIESTFAFANNNPDNSLYTCCYNKERQLINKSSIRPSNKLHSFLSETYKLRYKITYLTYEASLVYSSSSPIDFHSKTSLKTDNHMGLISFFRVLCSKLLSLDNDQVYYFLLAGLDSCVEDNFTKHAVQLMLLLTERIMYELSGFDSFDQIVKALQAFNSGKKKLAITLAINGMNSSEIYDAFKSRSNDSVSFVKAVERWTAAKTTLKAFRMFIIRWNEILFESRPIDHFFKVIEEQMQEVDDQYRAAILDHIKASQTEQEKQKFQRYYAAILDKRFEPRESTPVLVD